MSRGCCGWSYRASIESSWEAFLSLASDVTPAARISAKLCTPDGAPLAGAEALPVALSGTRFGARDGVGETCAPKDFMATTRGD